MGHKNMVPSSIKVVPKNYNTYVQLLVAFNNDMLVSDPNTERMGKLCFNHKSSYFEFFESTHKLLVCMLRRNMAATSVSQKNVIFTAN